MNKTQKEALCALLLMQDANYRTIQKKVHLSFSDIKKIQDKISGEDQNYQKNKKLSNSTKAIVLFSKGKSPLEITIQLDMDPKEVENAYKGFLMLNALNPISKIINDKEIQKFSNFYELCKKNQIDNATISYILNHKKNTSQLRYESESLLSRKQDIKNNIQKWNLTLQNIKDQVQQTEINLEYARSELYRVNTELNQKTKELSNQNQLIARFKNDVDNRYVEEKFQNIFNKIISIDALNLPLIFVAFLEVIRDNPIHNQIFYHYYQKFKDNNIEEDLQTKQEYIFFHFKNCLFDFSKKIQKIFGNKTIFEFYNDHIVEKS